MRVGRDQVGTDDRVQQLVLQQRGIKHVLVAAASVLARDGVAAIGCQHGRHRSVALVEAQGPAPLPGGQAVNTYSAPRASQPAFDLSVWPAGAG